MACSFKSAVLTSLFGLLITVSNGQTELPEAVAPAPAEAPNAQEEAQKQEIELQFLTMPSTPDPLVLQLIDDEGKATEIRVMSNTYSQPYLVNRSKVWRIGRKEAGKPVEILGEVAAIKEPRQLIFLISKGREKDSGYELVAAPNEIHMAAKGEMVVHNLGKIDFRAQIGEFDLKLKPGEQVVILPRGGPEGEWVQSTLSYWKVDRWKKFMDRRWPINETVRSAVYFYLHPTSGKVQLHTLTEVPPTDLSSL